MLNESTIAPKPLTVILVGIKDDPKRQDKRRLSLSAEESMVELSQLARTLGWEVRGILLQERDAPDPETYVGKGKARELSDLVSAEEASFVIVDGALSPAQARNLEDVTGVPAMDRAELILRIFASRAMTREGKLQVQLAAHRHRLSRLTGHGTEMSGQGGGIGTRGPGEQKIEMDRRLLRDKIAKLNRELQKVEQVRAEQRKRRKQSGIPLISLVGYTNAGKSTLFNALTLEETYQDDRLFATLDPWVRKWELPSGQVMLLVDTVGFIQGLPHELVAAFRSTLEESVDADVIVHVIDGSSPVWEQQVATVEGVLSDLGVSDRPRVNCFNKIDLLKDDLAVEILREKNPSVGVSALYGTGLAELTDTVVKMLAESRRTVTWFIPYAAYDVVFEIKRLGAILEERQGEDGVTVTCALLPADAERLAKRLGVDDQ
jgi:GTP-binding protein HflX